jgi:hypothetical protein
LCPDGTWGVGQDHHKDDLCKCSTLSTWCRSAWGRKQGQTQYRSASGKKIGIYVGMYDYLDYQSEKVFEVCDNRF